MKLKSTAFAFLAMLVVPLAASAQDYPTKQITMVIPFTPGGSNDVIGRYLANGLAKKWNQIVIVENRAGAGSAIGSAYVAKAKPDGHTLLFTSGTYTTNAAIKTSVLFNPEKDLVPVAPVAVAQFMMVAGSSVKSDNLKDFADEAKSRNIFYATSGLGSATHFIAELIASRMGIEMTPVHYKGSAEPLTDMMGGRIDIYVGSVPALLTAVEGKQVKAFGVTSATRLPMAPDIPTLAEAGLSGVETDQWWGVLTPAGTPQAVIDKLNAATNEIMSSPQAEEFLAKFGTVPKPMNAAAFQKLVHDELTNWKTLAAQRGIRAQ
ncbi:MAG: tripartite tricarboxylate transporter substrate-binding protein [Pseudomonadota bacterium]